MCHSKWLTSLWYALKVPSDTKSRLYNLCIWTCLFIWYWIHWDADHLIPLSTPVVRRAGTSAMWLVADGLSIRVPVCETDPMGLFRIHPPPTIMDRWMVNIKFDLWTPEPSFFCIPWRSYIICGPLVTAVYLNVVSAYNPFRMLLIAHWGASLPQRLQFLPNLYKETDDSVGGQLKKTFPVARRERIQINSGRKCQDLLGVFLNLRSGAFFPRLIASCWHGNASHVCFPFMWLG